MTPRPITKAAHNERRPRTQGDEGAAIIEFALVAPLLPLVIFSIVDFGYGYGQSGGLVVVR